jgi:hypothetical protein
MSSHGKDWPQVRRKLSVPGRVPRPFLKWLLGIFKQEPWKDSKDLDERIQETRKVVDAHNCGIVTDAGRHWRESVYLYPEDFETNDPMILVGSAGNPSYVCTVILHELGHHVLRSGRRHPRDVLAAEKAAWRVAGEIARKHRLPFVASIRRQALYSYRLAVLLDETRGSKRRNRRRLPKSWKMSLSQRSRAVSAAKRFDPMGKKGKRHVKRTIKRATSKAERRRPIPDD